MNKREIIATILIAPGLILVALVGLAVMIVFPIYAATQGDWWITGAAVLMDSFLIGILLLE